jgi:hypothetical protein
MKAFFMDSPWRIGGRSFIVPDRTTETLREDEKAEKKEKIYGKLFGFSAFSLFFFVVFVNFAPLWLNLCLSAL